MFLVFFFFQAEDGIRDKLVTGVQTCALPISASPRGGERQARGEAGRAREGRGREDRRPVTAQRARSLSSVPAASRHMGHTLAQPRSAENSPRTAMTTPSAILAAAAVARPTTAPHPTRTAVPGVRDREYSNTTAPANEPRNAPITLPIMGTGTPIAAPTIPPTSAPHADRGEPPYLRAKRNPSHHSMISPRKARPRATPMVATPTARKAVTQP